MSVVVVKQHARWINYQQYRFRLQDVQMRDWDGDGIPEWRTVFIVSDRQGRSALYVPSVGGFTRAGFTVGSEPLPTEYIHANLWDRLQIESELLTESDNE